MNDNMFKGLRLPVVQAPMAGITNSLMVAEACKAGVVGSLGAAMLSPADIQKTVAEVREQTDLAKQHLNVNLFVIDNYESGYKLRPNQAAWLEKYYEQYNLEPPRDVSKFAHKFEEQFETLLELAPPIASFTFGILSESQVDRLHAKGIYVVGTATTTAEAIAWEKVGADAICAQGYEAGGHRGHFLDPDHASDVGLFALIPEVKANVSIPVIAAGGITDAKGIKAALILGADAVQMGTIFLLSREATMPPAHRRAMAEGNQMAHDTTLTKAFTGKYARGIRNKYIQATESLSHEDFPPYPVLGAYTGPLKKMDPNSPDNLSLWSGQGISVARSQYGASSVAEIIKKLETEYRK